MLQDSLRLHTASHFISLSDGFSQSSVQGTEVLVPPQAQGSGTAAVHGGHALSWHT